MLFNSWLFLVFAAVVLPVYYCLPQRAQNRWLLVASYVFYGTWDWRFLFLIALTTTIDYWVGHSLHVDTDEGRRKRWVALSVVVNLTILGFFKYFNFFVDSFVVLAAGLGIEPDVRTLEIILPVGISFYTFQSISYVIDVYRRQVQPTRDYLDFALYVAFFPQLVAGPIERARHLLGQISRHRVVCRADWIAGGWLILLGYFKKVVIADNLAPVVDQVFDPAVSPTALEWIIGLYAFALQIYCDFSGYTDIARGLARIMGFNLMLNFRLPYLARNPADFWHRWHISLSTWLRDYLYIPLGGNRGGRLKTYRNLMLTMLLGGLWHGAAWHFVLWGGYQGLLLIAHRLWRKWRGPGTEPGELQLWLQRFFMFQLICLGWLLFRVDSVDQIYGFFAAFGGEWVPTTDVADMLSTFLLFATLLVVVEIYTRGVEDPRPLPAWGRGGGAVVVGVLLGSLFLLSAPVDQGFIYFQF